MREGKKDEAETIKQEVKKINEELIEREQKEEKYKSEIK